MPRMGALFTRMQEEGKISPESRIVLVDDGSKDATLHELRKLYKAQLCPFSLSGELPRNNI